MRSNGISVGNIGGVTINGIRCGLVSDLACDIAAAAMRSGADEGSVEHKGPEPTRAELDIAEAAARKLRLWRMCRIPATATRKKFVQFIVDAAQNVRENSEDSANAGPGPTISEG